MAAGTPFVMTDTCGLAPDAAGSGAGRVTASDPRSLAAAVVELLRHPAERAATGAAGVKVAADRFNIEAVADRLESVYRAVRAGERVSPGPGWS